ncbi:ribulose-phosphate 3-epimerase [Vallitalea pronyensis]|uniref:Ribulose-phosphate 3-epimerase n=1 Tax=Vallitalea pronyensis TaxID=1348613 RepID=A0A8J8MJ87_9FIRM|nr:ribulose-phosphate 3-epimerase [Vallitalea pronyensis]QUI22268.1 ribulose-phosphate 3-epimerase [Vallitalea pronyensis]
MRLSATLACASQINMIEDIRELEKAGIDLLHIDIMDGNYVPNLSLNFRLCQEIKETFPNMALDIHMMVTNPLQYIKQAADIQAEWFTFHMHATHFPCRMIDAIKQSGMKAGVAINPSEPISNLLPIIAKVDMVLLMAIEPGFSGQQFMDASYERISQLNKIRQEKQLDFIINVDGGIDPVSGKKSIESGADLLVMGMFACFNQVDSIWEACMKFHQHING